MPSATHLTVSLYIYSAGSNARGKSRALEGLFELTWRPLRAFNLPFALLQELQRNKDTVSFAALGAEVAGHRQEQLTQTLIVRLLKTHFFTPIPDFEKSTE